MTRTLKLTGLAAVLILAATGCVTTNNAGVADFQHHVRAGMTEAQIRDVLGQPRRVTIPWRHKLQGWMKVVEFDLNYANEAGCPENEIGNALVSFATLGLSEVARQAKNRYRYRLYFYQGRFVAGCRVAKKPPFGRFCQQLESDLIRLGYAGWTRTNYAARPRPARVEPAAWHRPQATGSSTGPAGRSHRLQTGAWPASDPGYHPGQGKHPGPDPNLGHGTAMPPPPPGSIAPRW